MNTNRVVGLLVSLMLLGATVTRGAQDDWLEECQLPDFADSLQGAGSAQDDGDTLAFLDNMRDVADDAHQAYIECLGAVAQAGDDLVGANLADAQLIGADLLGANLQGADLHGAQLIQANLYHANLQGADLIGANLQEAHLYGASLQGANLRAAHLQEADLRGANLQGANLYWTHLQEASLYGANLQEANLIEAIFAANIILPDVTFWTPDTDMARFTDPAHPDFWDPCVELSRPQSAQPYCYESDG